MEEGLAISSQKSFISSVTLVALMENIEESNIFQPPRYCNRDATEGFKMSDILTVLRSLAVSLFRNKAEKSIVAQNWLDGFILDPVLREGQRTSLFLSLPSDATIQILDFLSGDPDFANIAPREGELDPMVMHPRGGFRISPERLVASLFSSALLKMYYLRLPDDEDTFARTVLEGFEELQKAVRGEPVGAYVITGLGQITLPTDKKISTPWGEIRPAPAASSEQPFLLYGPPKTTCILAEPRKTPIKIDRAQSPEGSFDAGDSVPSRSRYLLPLACALASKDTSSPVAPIITWSIFLLPFQGGSYISSEPFSRTFGAEVDLNDRIAAIEKWARIVDDAHTSSVDIAARRLISAIAHRVDRSDALIDAVMVWENLLGTSTEVSFRVSASLAKLLECNPENRKVLRKKLSKIYDVRSRLVHGATVNNSDLHKTCADAIDISVKALQACYCRGRDWLSLSSTQRSDAILLEWQ